MTPVVPGEVFDTHAKLIAENALLRRSLAQLAAQLNTQDERAAQYARVEANAEALLESLERIAGVLKTFYQSPPTAGSLQPILDLAREFNPDLTGPKR